MNLKRIAASLAATAALVTGGATAAHADSNAVFTSPGPGSCGQLLNVVIWTDGVADFLHRDCQRQATSSTDPNFPGSYRTYASPTAAQREACGGVLLSVVYRASDDKAVFRYASCDYAKSYHTSG